MERLITEYKHTKIVGEIEKQYQARIVEFLEVMDLLEQFKRSCSERACDTPRDIDEWHQIDIYWYDHPHNHVVSYWNVEKEGLLMLSEDSMRVLKENNYDIKYIPKDY